MSMFTSDPEVRAIGSRLLHFMVPTFITYIVIEIFSGALRGVGDAWMPMLIAGVGICSVRILWITFGLPHVPNIIGAAFCYPLSWILSSAAFIVYYLRFSKLSRRKETKLYSGQ